MDEMMQIYFDRLINALDQKAYHAAEDYLNAMLTYLNQIRDDY